MKIGIVGVGKWGRTLARKFAACGAEIAAHDRRSDVAMPDRFGRRMRWKDMLEDPAIDAIVAAAPPGTTTNVVLAAQGRKHVFATKPLTMFPQVIHSTTYVDFVHLSSVLYHMLIMRTLQHCATGAKIESIDVTSLGPTVRSFPAAIDYGVHAAAMLLDLGRVCGPSVTKLLHAASEEESTGREKVRAGFSLGGPYTTKAATATLIAGNMTMVQETSICVAFDDGLHLGYWQDESGATAFRRNGITVAVDRHPDPLKDLILQFLTEEPKPVMPNDKFVVMSAPALSMVEEARRASDLEPWSELGW